MFPPVSCVSWCLVCLFPRVVRLFVSAATLSSSQSDPPARLLDDELHRLAQRASCAGEESHDDWCGHGGVSRMDWRGSANGRCEAEAEQTPTNRTDHNRRCTSKTQ